MLYGGDSRICICVCVLLALACCLPLSWLGNCGKVGFTASGHQGSREAVKTQSHTLLSIWLPRKAGRNHTELSDTLRTLLSFPYHMAEKATRKP